MTLPKNTFSGKTEEIWLRQQSPLPGAPHRHRHRHLRRRLTIIVRRQNRNRSQERLFATDDVRRQLNKFHLEDFSPTPAEGPIKLGNYGQKRAQWIAYLLPNSAALGLNQGSGVFCYNFFILQDRVPGIGSIKRVIFARYFKTSIIWVINRHRLS